MVLFLILWMLMAFAAGALAAQKGRSAAAFGILGFFLGPIGILAAAAAKPAVATGGLRPCPHCAEPIQPAAKVCRFCGREVAPLDHAQAADPDEGMTMRDRVMR